MKKLLVVLGVLMFCTSAFALNAAGTNACPGKTDFEKKANSQEDHLAIQKVMFELADPLATMTDEQAQPLAVCYVTYQVHKRMLPDYVRMHAKKFASKGARQEAARMRDFAARIEVLNEKVDFDQMAQQESDYFIAQNMLINYAEPFLQLPVADAAAKAKYYANFQVKGHSLNAFVEEITVENPEFDGLRRFVSRIEELAASK